MTDKKPISLELKIYTTFVEGMMIFHQNLTHVLSLNPQELVNFMHAEGKKYVIGKMRNE